MARRPRMRSRPSQAGLPASVPLLQARLHRLLDATCLPLQIPFSAELRPCHQCWGHGRMRCRPCDGHGKVQCNSCGGAGEKAKFPTDANDPPGLKMQCSMCEGKGAPIHPRTLMRTHARMRISVRCRREAQVHALRPRWRREMCGLRQVRSAAVVPEGHDGPSLAPDSLSSSCTCAHIYVHACVRA
jgi:hypothetical protein